MPVASNAVDAEERYQTALEQAVEATEEHGDALVACDQAATKHAVKDRLVELFDDVREEVDRDV
jgi:hypothetical protein